MPRRRPRAPRLSRMDAAVDAMMPFGFPEKRVKEFVKKLLKEYGGDEGWPFIEDSSYTVLLESLLDEQDDQQQITQNAYLLEGTSCGNRASDGDLAPPDVCTDLVTSADLVPPDVCTDPVTSAGEITNAGEAADDAQLPALDSTDMLVGSNRRRCVPCYGWIDSDEDDADADEFILLTPAPCTVFGDRATMAVTTWKKKRRSGWDVKPSDP